MFTACTPTSSTRAAGSAWPPAPRSSPTTAAHRHRGRDRRWHQRGGLAPRRPRAGRSRADDAPRVGAEGASSEAGPGESWATRRSDAAALAGAVAQRPRAPPGRCVGSGERRGGARGGPLPRLPPVGGGLVGQLGDGALDALGVAVGALALLGAQRRAEGHAHLRRAWGASRPCGGSARCPRGAPAPRARRSGSTGRRRRPRNGCPQPSGERPPSGKISIDQPSSISSAAWSAVRRVTFERSIGMAPIARRRRGRGDVGLEEVVGGRADEDLVPPRLGDRREDRRACRGGCGGWRRRSPGPSG